MDALTATATRRPSSPVPTRAACPALKLAQALAVPQAGACRPFRLYFRIEAIAQRQRTRFSSRWWFLCTRSNLCSLRRRSERYQRHRRSRRSHCRRFGGLEPDSLENASHFSASQQGHFLFIRIDRHEGISSFVIAFALCGIEPPSSVKESSLSSTKLTMASLASRITAHAPIASTSRRTLSSTPIVSLYRPQLKKLRKVKGRPAWHPTYYGVPDRRIPPTGWQDSDIAAAHPLWQFFHNKDPTPLIDTRTQHGGQFLPSLPYHELG